jgi:1-hydroxy-2-isopentenylcarotenoid 3,4-desaturase
MKSRIVIVGAGFGGLAAAAVLARNGMDVTVLEKNDQVGGRARVWQKDGFSFDMGPSWYLMPEVFDRFFENLGTKREDMYELARLDPYYRVFFGGEDSADVSGDMAKTKALFDRFEPGGGTRLEQYLAQARYKYDVAMEQFLYRDYRTIFDFFNAKLLFEGSRLNVFQSLDRFVERYFKDHRAKQILEYAMVFLGSSPSNAPALYSIMSHVDLNLGVFYPQGGMGVVAKAMQRLAESFGARFHFSTPAEAFRVEDKRIAAVEAGGESFPADTVLVNADYAFAERSLVPAEYRTYGDAYWDKRVVAPSMYVIFLGLDTKVPKLAHHSLYFEKNWTEHFDQVFIRPVWPEKPCYYVSCPSKTDPSVAPADGENLFILVPVAAGLDDSDQVRDAYFDQVLSHLESVVEQPLRRHILVKRIFSHRDFREAYNALEGTALGLAHTLRQTAIFRPRHRSKKLPNLFYSGQYTHPGVGVPMAIISSEVVAREIVQGVT